MAVQLALRPSLHPVPDPQRLSARAEASARELIRQGQSENTRASYEAAMRYWCRADASGPVDAVDTIDAQAAHGQPVQAAARKTGRKAVKKASRKLQGKSTALVFGWRNWRRIGPRPARLLAGGSCTA
jgi:hypothetical protein